MSRCGTGCSTRLVGQHVHNKSKYRMSLDQCDILQVHYHIRDNVPPVVFGRLLKTFFFSEYSCMQRIRGFSGSDALYKFTFYHARRSLSTVGGTHSGQSTPHYCPPLIHLHSPPCPRNGVRSHSRCGTESWTELELAFHLTVTFLIRLQGPNDSLH